MKDPVAYIQPHIRALKPYSTARDECSCPMEIYLDANESPFDNGYNRYPSPTQDALKEKLSAIKGVPANQLFVGNGSDEAIDLLFRIFCESGKSSAVILSPSYGMYTVAAQVNRVQVIEAPLRADFSLDASALLASVRPDTRLVFLCSPNNPSGNLMDEGEVERILNGFDGIVVMDEAYIDFSLSKGWLSRLSDFPRLVVLQTLSKAWGMAGLRLGMAFAHPSIIQAMNRIKYPYNINVLTQKAVCRELGRLTAFRNQVEVVCKERQCLSQAMASLPCVERVFPSEANFLLVRFVDKQRVWDQLTQAGIVVRDRSGASGCEGCLRLTVGTPAENSRLLEVLTESGTSAGDTLASTAFVSRTTRETSIRVAVDLDRGIAPRIDTGLKFLDHMLEQIGYHSGIGLTLDAVGDLATDDHHTVEDVAIALGDALFCALEKNRTRERYGFALPMDESNATVLLDLGSRSDFLWNVSFSQEMIGDVHAVLFEHFFRSLSQHLRCNLHITASGTNDHHLIEAIFKAFARALKAALRKDLTGCGLPSSKGLL